jgi:hypothetical protein
MVLLAVLLLVEDVVIGWDSPCETVGGLTLEQYQLWGCRVVENALKVHCVMNFILGL